MRRRGATDTPVAQAPGQVDWIMRRNLVWAVVVVAAAVIQTTWLDAIKLQGVLPDLTLMLVVYFAIVDGEERAMFTGLLGGVYQDVAGNMTLGHHVLCNVLVGYIIGRVATRLITEHPAVRAGLVFCSGLVHGLIYTAVVYVQEPTRGALYTLATSVIPAAFYTAVATPLVFFMLARLFPRDTRVRFEEA